LRSRGAKSGRLPRKNGTKLQGGGATAAASASKTISFYPRRGEMNTKGRILSRALNVPQIGFSHEGKGDNPQICSEQRVGKRKD